MLACAPLFGVSLFLPILVPRSGFRQKQQCFVHDGDLPGYRQHCRELGRHAHLEIDWKKAVCK
jgi:hypothetical protein